MNPDAWRPRVGTVVRFVHRGREQSARLIAVSDSALRFETWSGWVKRKEITAVGPSPQRL